MNMDGKHTILSTSSQQYGISRLSRGGVEILAPYNMRTEAGLPASR